MSFIQNATAACLAAMLLAACSKPKANAFDVAHRAVSNHDLAALRIAISADPSLVSQGSGFDGGTLLRSALTNTPSFECAEFLLAHGADPNQPDVTGEYPIHVICRYNGDADCLKLLLKNGADPSVKWKGRRMSSADLARKWHFTEAASILDAAVKP